MTAKQIAEEALKNVDLIKEDPESWLYHLKFLIEEYAIEYAIQQNKKQIGNCIIAVLESGYPYDDRILEEIKSTPTATDRIGGIDNNN
jgi:hypothetical protein